MHLIYFKKNCQLNDKLGLVAERSRRLTACPRGLTFNNFSWTAYKFKQYILLK